MDRRLTLSAYLDGRTAILPGNEDPLSILLLSEYKFRQDLRFDTMLELGLSDGLRVLRRPATNGGEQLFGGSGLEHKALRSGPVHPAHDFGVIVHR